MSECISTLNFTLILVAALVEIHILEEWAWKFFESASRYMQASVVIPFTTSMTIFICLINFQKVIAIKLLPNSLQESLPFTNYVRISGVTSVIFLAARSPFIMIFNMERSLINMYLAFIFVISVVVILGKNSTQCSFAILLASYSSLILGLLSLTHIANPSELTTTFIMVNMITFTIFLDVLVLILSTSNSKRLIVGPCETLESFQTMNKDSKFLAQEGLSNDEHKAERSTEMGENFSHEIIGKDENGLKYRIKEEYKKESEKTTNVAEVIIDDICSRIEIIKECANFLISKT